MAKRYKLSGLTDTKQLGNDLLQNAIHVQNLMSSHELEKIRKLDNEMSHIVKKNDLTAAEKVRMFEDKLMEFRRVQEKIAREGTELIPQQAEESSFDTEKGQAALEMALQKMVEKIIKPKTEKHPTRASTTTTTSPLISSTPSNRTLVAPKPVDTTEQNPDDFHTPPSSMVSPVNTPTQQHNRHSRKRSSAIGPPRQRLSVLQKMEEVLQQNGVINDEDAGFVYFPVKTEDKARVKKNQLRYARKTFEKAMEHLLSSKQRSAPNQTNQLVKHIYNNLNKDSQEFDDMLKVYPNLKDLHNITGSGLNVEKWVRLM